MELQNQTMCRGTCVGSPSKNGVKRSSESLIPVKDHDSETHAAVFQQAVNGGVLRTWRVLTVSLCGLAAIVSFGVARANEFVLSSETARIPWTSSRVIGSPEPSPPYELQDAFPNLQFTRPTVLTNAPDTNRLFVGSRNGQVWSLAPDRNVSAADVILDLGREIYGMAFHPKFTENRFVFLFITERKPEPPRTRIARFQVGLEPPFLIDPDSEYVILEFPSNGHDGGCLKFGPDGFLYIGVGDGGNANDVHNTGQFLGDLLASILRIDVDGTHSAASYAIPEDNPFLQTPGARSEIWAYGFRQPWKFSFDRKTGALWVGDVGQQLWEMIYRVDRGGNYGWSIMEGPQQFRPQRRQGPTPIIPPVHAYQHHEGRSVTGGFVYRGQRFPDLHGLYVFADYETGRVWGLKSDGKSTTWRGQLARTDVDIGGFAEDHDGELYLLTHEDGRIYELQPAKPIEQPHPFPRRLSETGLFASVADHTPAPGVVPYTVNVPLWSDGAAKDRLLALPGHSTMTFRRDAPWTFPDRTVLVKTFSLELQPGIADSARRLETRILTLQGKNWAGYTYLWNDEQTDAELLGPEPLEKSYSISDFGAPDRTRKQTWYFPSRADCRLCHNGSFRVLGINTPQINRLNESGNGTRNQLARFQDLGLFTEPLPESLDDLPGLWPIEDESGPIEKRARSYLHANCAHCHRHKGGGNSDFKLLAGLPLSETNTLNVRPLHDTLGVNRAGLIVPGVPERSLVLHRMSTTGRGRMPQLATNQVDVAAVSLLRRWIEELPDVK